MKQIEVVAAAIYQDGKVLAAQRGYGEFKGGCEFPRGKIEPGETQEQSHSSRDSRANGSNYRGVGEAWHSGIRLSNLSFYDALFWDQGERWKAPAFGA